MSSTAQSITNTGLIPPIDASTLQSSEINLNDLEQESFGNPNAPIASNAITAPGLAGVTGNALSSAASDFFSPSNIFKDLFGGGLGLSTSQIAQNLGDKEAGLSPTNSPSSFWSDLFLRSVLIILGFIFVAIALSMFGNKAATTIVNEVKRSYS